VDTGARIYDLPWAPNPDWSKTFPEQQENWQYQKDIVKNNGIRSHIQLNSKIVGGEWVAEKHCYALHIERRDPQGLNPTRLETVFANVVIQALGGANQFPKYPEVWESGAGVFSGDMFHSAGWLPDLDLTGKRAGIIGNAASATQIVPALSKEPSTHVVNFCQTPNWFATRVCVSDLCALSLRCSAEMNLQRSSHSKYTRRLRNGCIVLFLCCIKPRDFCAI